MFASVLFHLIFVISFGINKTCAFTYCTLDVCSCEILADIIKPRNTGHTSHDRGYYHKKLKVTQILDSRVHGSLFSHDKSYKVDKT